MDIVGSPFTTRVEPGPTSAAPPSACPFTKPTEEKSQKSKLGLGSVNLPGREAGCTCRCIGRLREICVSASQVHSLITGTGLEYAEAGVEARGKQGLPCFFVVPRVL